MEPGGRHSRLDRATASARYGSTASHARWARWSSRPTCRRSGGLRFSEWSAREENRNLLLLRSRYRQPFGTFAGSLPGGGELAEGYGVMEEHEAWW